MIQVSSKLDAIAYFFAPLLLEGRNGRAGATTGGRAMIKKELYEELIVHVDKEELTELLGMEPGFAVQQIEEVGEEFRLIFSRKTDLTEKTRRREARGGLFE